MLMFERYFESKPPRRFYSCSAFRDRKECNFFQWEDESPSIASQDAHRQIIEASKPSISHTQCLKRLKRVRCLKESQRAYCHTCAQLLLPKEMDKHNDHEMTSGISDDIVSSPSYLFKPLDKKKSFAVCFSFFLVFSHSTCKYSRSTVYCHVIALCSQMQFKFNYSYLFVLGNVCDQPRIYFQAWRNLVPRACPFAG